MLVELNKQSGARPHAVILMASESSVTPRRTRIMNPSSLQQLPSGQEVSEILQQMCGEISQTTTAEMAEIANSPASQSKLQDLLPVYFYSWQLKSPEAVIIHLLLNYFILWRDGSEMRRDRQAFEEQVERLKSRVAELEKMRARELEPDINRLTKQFQDLKLENERLQRALNEVDVCPSVFPAWLAKKKYFCVCVCDHSIILQDDERLLFLWYAPCCQTA